MSARSPEPLAPTNLFGYIWAQRARVASFFILRLVSVIVILPFPFITKVIVDDMIPTGDLAGMALMTGLAIACLVAHLYSAWASISRLAIAVPQMMRTIRARIFQKFQFLHFSFHDLTQTGRLLAKYAFDTQKIEGALIPILHAIIPELFRSLSLIAALALIDWHLILFVALIAPFFAVLRWVFFKRVKAQNKQSRLAEAALTGQASEFISAIKLVRGFGQEREVRQRMEQASSHYADMRQAQFSLNQQMQVVSFMLSNGANILAVSFGAVLVIQSDMTIGTLMAFIAALPVILGPIGLLTQFSQQYLLGRESYQSVKELVESHFVEKWQGKRVIDRLTGDLELKDVRFRYSEEGDEVLRGINLQIKAGQHVAFVGPSGSGKSTIVNLILGLYAPTEGEIRIDGIPQAELAMRRFRRQCAIVMQDNILLSGTLLENLRFARPDASLEEVKDAARQANCMEFINQLPDGFETLVGERGVSLSGGQRQRVAIARALLRDPRVLILDEATSALDYESEKLVQQALDHLARNRTTITIAHRLSTVRAADRIVVLRGGTVMEEGTYTQLADREGSYFRELLEAQG